MKKSIIATLLLLSSSIASMAQDTYQVIKINGDTPVRISGKTLKVGDTFSSQDTIVWTDKNLSIEAKQTTTGTEHRFSSRQFTAKGRDVKSIDGLCNYTTVDAARDENGRQKINIRMKETNKGDYYPEKRIALLIGNSFYNTKADNQQKKNSKKECINFSSMPEAQRKTEIFTDSLNELGFDVLECYDLNSVEFKSIVERFAIFTEEYQVALMYYAGHSVKEADANAYLVPVNLIQNDSAFNSRAFSCQQLIDTFNKISCKTRYIILDSPELKDGLPTQITNGVDGITFSYSLNDDVLGSRSENLYIKKKEEERREYLEMQAAINALANIESSSASYVPTTTQEYFDEGMRITDQRASDYDLDKGMTYLKKAANNGHTEAMYQLALLYEKKDPTQSMIWMGRASSAGHAKAKEYVAARKQAPKTKVVYFPKDK